MNTAQIELPTRGLKEYSKEYKISEIVQDTANHDRDLLNKTTEQVRVMEPLHTVEKATPAASVPVPATPELEAVGAERVGSEVPHFVSDARHGIKIGKSLLLGGGTWGRIVNGIKGTRMVNERQTQKAKLSPDHFQHDLFESGN